METLACRASFPGWDGGLLDAPLVVWSLILSNACIAFIFFALSIGIFMYATARKGGPPFPEVLIMLAMVFHTCGWTHVFKIIVMFTPSFWGAATANWLTVAVSGVGVAVWWRKYHGIIDYVEATRYMRRFVQRQQEELFERIERLEGTGKDA